MFITNASNALLSLLLTNIDPCNQNYFEPDTVSIQQVDNYLDTLQAHYFLDILPMYQKA